MISYFDTVAMSNVQLCLGAVSCTQGDLKTRKNPFILLFEVNLWYDRKLTVYTLLK